VGIKKPEQDPERVSVRIFRISKGFHGNFKYFSLHQGNTTYKTHRRSFRKFCFNFKDIQDKFISPQNKGTGQKDISLLIFS
jgi:hypothetical protein